MKRLRLIVVLLTTVLGVSLLHAQNKIVVLGGTLTGTSTGTPVPTFPNTPATPAPADAATNQATTATVSWAVSANASSYTIFFGTATVPQSTTPVSTEQAGLTYDPGTLINGVTYYWQVVANGVYGFTTGPIWSFTVITGVPGTPSVIFPADATTGVTQTPLIQWTAVGGTTCDVKLQINTTPPVTTVSSGQACTSYQSGSLTLGGLYYLQIIAHNAGGTTNGPITSFTVMAASGSGGGGNLIHWSTDATYLYSFKIGCPDSSGVSCGQIKNTSGVTQVNANSNLSIIEREGITYNATNHSLFIACGGPNSNTTWIHVMEVGIPAKPANFSAASTSTWPTATNLQQCHDPTENTLAESTVFGSSSISMGGMLVSGGYLFINYYISYDGTNAQRTKATYRRPTNLSTLGQVTGPYYVNFPLTGTGNLSNPPVARWVNGWMGTIPSEWQSAFGGNTHMIGTTSHNISAGTSNGQDAIAWNPTNWGATNTGSPIMYFSASHPVTGGGYNPCNNYVGGVPPCPGAVSTVWNSVTIMGGCFWPDSTRSLVCIQTAGGGTQATGAGGIWQGGECYGHKGTTVNPPPQGSNAATSTCWATSIDNGAGPGTFATPTYIYDLAFDGNDLANVANASINPWAPVPYENADITANFPSVVLNADNTIGQVAWDATHRYAIVSTTNKGGPRYYHVFLIGTP